ncbi:MAG TPA: Rieske (2Fe-2S) protein [bacterium]|nr:Rieske (2Fe-2S) protein [bacterium]
MAPDEKEQPEKKMTRRGALDLLLAMGGAIWGLGMAVPAAVYLWPARSSGPAEAVVKVGAVNDLAVGAAKMVQSRGRPIIVLRLGADEFKAFSAICTHLGCVVEWDPARTVISCPCHAGVFSPDGQVVSGPPPAPLKAYPVMVVGGEVRVKVS